MNRTELSEFLSICMPSVKLSAINTASTKIYKAGLISGGGRGPSIFNINAKDAANIILGVLTTSSPVKAADVLRICRELKGEKAPCCGLSSENKKSWTIGELLEKLLENVEACGNLEKLVVCRTEPYAELHWAKDGKPESMIFGKKPIDPLRVDCTLMGFVLHQLSVQLGGKCRGTIDYSTGKKTYFD